MTSYYMINVTFSQPIQWVGVGSGTAFDVQLKVHNVLENATLNSLSHSTEIYPD